jgi:hypothetical protein
MAVAYGSDGTIPERTLRFAIDAEKEPMGITEDVPFARVADFGPLHAAALTRLGARRRLRNASVRYPVGAGRDGRGVAAA